MIPLALDEIGALCPGRLQRAPDAELVSGLEIDSRLIQPGDLFVAIRGGVLYVDEALARGAAAALVPEEPFQAMAALGRVVRERTNARVVAITGATGKTSTKDILAALCRPHLRTVAAEQSLNNEIGLPLTLTRATAETELVICELGTRGPGQVAELCEIASPDHGVIAQIGPAHLELFGTVEAVAAAEAEIVDALPRGGSIVVPAGEPLLEPHLARTDVDVITYGDDGDVRLLSFEAGEHARLEVEAFGQLLELEFSFRSRHNATNALAALAAYGALALPLAEAGRGALDVSLSRWREEERPLEGGGVLINDAYNANPTSMAAALRHLAERAYGRRRVAVLGEMAELGDAAPAYHGQIGRAARDAGIEVLVAVGPLARGYLETADGVPERLWAPDAQQAVELLRPLLRPGDCVLVKGSRSVGLEAVADALSPAAAA